MQYKVYSYEISDSKEKTVAPDRHYGIFQGSIGRDSSGRFASYRGRRDTLLMELRKFGSDFTGLIGRHSTEREVTKYDEGADEVRSKIESDDDYPHTGFICFPRLGQIASVDATIKADAALQRLHQILLHRQKVFFTFESNKEPVDLRKAVKRFRVIEVNFEVLPVNPHTGPLGAALDADRARDHIRRLKGKAEGTPANPIELNGGIVTAVQQLQQSGHAKIGFKGVTEGGVEVVVPKPSKTQELSDEGDKKVHGEDIDVKVNFPKIKFEYPPSQGHVTAVRKIVRDLKDEDDGEQ